MGDDDFNRRTAMIRYSIGNCGVTACWPAVTLWAARLDKDFAGKQGPFRSRCMSRHTLSSGRHTSRGRTELDRETPAQAWRFRGWGGRGWGGWGRGGWGRGWGWGGRGWGGWGWGHRWGGWGWGGYGWGGYGWGGWGWGWPSYSVGYYSPSDHSWPVYGYAYSPLVSIGWSSPGFCW